MRFRGHPWLGAISGLFLGFGVAVLLQQFSVRPLDNLSFFGLPFLGIVLGLAMAAWAPFHRGRASGGVETTPAAASPPPPPPADTPLG